MSDDTDDVGGDDLTFSAEETAQLAAMRSGEARPVEAPEKPVQAEKPEGQDDAAKVADAAQKAPEGQDKADKQRTVPHEALHSEREKRKAVEAENQKLRENSIRLEERTNFLLKQYQAPTQLAQTAKEPPKAPPDPDEDVFGAVKHDRERFNGEIGQIRKEIETYKQNEQRKALTNEIVDRVGEAENQFRQSNPDYDEAVAHFKQRRVAELRAWGVPENKLGDAIMREAFQLAANAIQRGLNPAAVTYHTALSRGYAKKAPVSEKPPAPSPAEAEAEKLARVEAGQGASKTLSDAGGKAGGAEIDAKALAAMSEEDFEAFAKKNPRKFERLMGRAA